MENKEKELREEFQNFADSIIWSNNDGSEKYIGVGNMADWWVKKIDLLLKSKQEEIEKKIKSVASLAECENVADGYSKEYYWHIGKEDFYKLIAKILK